ncbi:hypothetical protein [Komagataeibacter sp. SM21]|uniref:hypothetical protein n=1 Tax=Komagataeibacter sp. SM21 TaxID=3242899 RepID=UPI003527DE1C
MIRQFNNASRLVRRLIQWFRHVETERRRAEIITNNVGITNWEGDYPSPWFGEGTGKADRREV